MPNTDPPAYERESAEPLRAINDNAAASWLHGYHDGYAAGDVNPPEQHVAEYLRGFIAGLRDRPK